MEDKINQAINAYFGVDDYRTDMRDPGERYASFDHCYNYFYTFYRNGEVQELATPANLQMSCLQLGFFLASWGMYRGRSFLLQKSVDHYKETISTIANSDPKLWEIDVEDYDEENIALILGCIDEIYDALGKENGATWTLLSKIMLGVYCNIPAFDTNFRASFRVSYPTQKTLMKLRNFYERNREVLDSIEIPTLDFKEGKLTDILYPKVKLIDMYGFIDGQ